MKNPTYIQLFLFFIIAILIVPPSLGDTPDLNGSKNLSSDNVTSLQGDIEYPLNGTLAAEGLDYKKDGGLYADGGGISTSISGSSVDARGTGQNPSAEVTFSDKSAVSGLIKNFMKSFHWESGVDL